MTDMEGLSPQAIIAAVQQVLREQAPGLDPQDVEEFIRTLRECDLDELEVNIGAGFGQFFDSKAETDAAFARYGELVAAVSVIPNPSPPRPER